MFCLSALNTRIERSSLKNFSVFLLTKLSKVVWDHNIHPVQNILLHMANIKAVI